MAITFDNNTSGVGSGNPSFSFSYTIGAQSNMLCLVAIVLANLTSDNFPQFCTVGGVSAGLIEFPTIAGGSSNGLQVWGISNPPSGSQTITMGVTGSGAVNGFYAAYTYYNVGGVDGHTSIAQQVSAGTSISLSLTNSEAGGLVWATEGWFNSNTSNNNSGAVPTNNNTGQNTTNQRFSFSGDYAVSGSPTSQTISNNCSVSTTSAYMAMVSLLPLPTPASVTSGVILRML